MRLNPENILRKLEEYHRIGEEIRELHREYGRVEGQIRSTIFKLVYRYVKDEELAHEVTNLIADVVKREDTLTPETVKERAYGRVGAELTLEIMSEEEAEKVRRTISTIPPKAYAEIIKETADLRKKLRELGEKIRELEKRKREIFWVVEGDVISIDTMVKLVYKCIKYALEEGTEEVR